VRHLFGGVSCKGYDDGKEVSVKMTFPKKVTFWRTGSENNPFELIWGYIHYENVFVLKGPYSTRKIRFQGSK
jgi:hypothetical protein